jgi:hypothetical protein
MAEFKENKGIMYGCLEAGGLFVLFLFLCCCRVR